MLDGVADFDHEPRALADLERRADAPELEAVHELHDDHRRIRRRPDLEDADDAPILEERHRPRFAEECRGVARRARIAAYHLGRDEAVEREVAHLEDLAHAAGAEPLDGLEAFELGQRTAIGRRGGDRRDRPDDRRGLP